MKEDEHKIRFLILQEWTAKRTVKQALNNICRHLGEKAVSEAAVRTWFEKFDAGDKNLRDKNDENYDEPLVLPADAYLTCNRSILCSVDSWALGNGFVTNNGRIGFAFRFEYPDHKAFVVVDLFHGKIKHLAINNDLFFYTMDSYFFLTVVDDERLFVEESFSLNGNYARHLFLLHLNQENRSCTILNHFDISDDSGALVVDQSDRDRFAIFSYNKYRRGRITNTEIIIDDAIDIVTSWLYCLQLNGNQVRTLVGSQDPSITAHLYVEYNLDTDTIDRHLDLPALPHPKHGGNWRSWDVARYVWSGNALYMTFFPSYMIPSVYKLDLINMSWSEVDVNVVGIPNSLFIDEDGFLTVSALETSPDTIYGPDDRCQVAVHRFPMKRPDSLMNIAWKTIRFYHNFQASDMYEKVFNRLPYNSHLRCAIPEA